MSKLSLLKGNIDENFRILCYICERMLIFAAHYKIHTRKQGNKNETLHPFNKTDFYQKLVRIFCIDSLLHRLRRSSIAVQPAAFSY